MSAICVLSISLICAIVTIVCEILISRKKLSMVECTHIDDPFLFAGLKNSVKLNEYLQCSSFLVFLFTIIAYIILK